MQQQLFCSFRPLGPDLAALRLPDLRYSLPAEVDPAFLSNFINQVLVAEDSTHHSVQFSCLLQGEIVRGPLIEHVRRHQLSTQTVHEISFFVARTAPTLRQSTEQEDWILRLKPLDSVRLVTCSFNQTVNLFSVEPGLHQVCRLEGAGEIQAADICSFEDSLWVVTATPADIRLSIIQVSVGSLSLANTAVAEEEKVYSLAFDQVEPTRVAAGTASGKIALYRLEQGLLSAESQLLDCKDRVSAMSWAGNRLLAGSFDHHFRVFDTEKGQCTRSLVCKDSVVTGLDQRLSRTLTCHEDAYIKLWDQRQTIPAQVYKAHSRLVSQVRWNPAKAEQFASGSYDQSVKVWDTRSPDCLLAESMHDDKVFDLAWMPEGRLASGGADNKVGLLAW